LDKYYQLFQVLDHPMIIIESRRNKLSIIDANRAFLQLTGYSLEHYLKLDDSALRNFHQIDPSRGIYTREKTLFGKNRNRMVRVTQHPFAFDLAEATEHHLLIYEDLTSVKWIDQKASKDNVLISGVVDKALRIRFLRNKLSTLMLQLDDSHEDEALLQYLTGEQFSLLQEAFQRANTEHEEQSIKLRTKKLNGIELELSITFISNNDAMGNFIEFAFIISDVKPVNGQADSGVRLKVLMAKRDMSALELAAATSISLQTISKLRNGKIKKPQRLTAELIASELRVDVREIWPEIGK